MSQIPSPDQLFWYTLASLLSLALIWVVGRYVVKNDKLHEDHNAMFKVMSGAVDELKTMVKLNELRIEHLEDKKIVRYKK